MKKFLILIFFVLLTMCVFAGEDDDFIDKTDSVLPPTTVSVEIVD